jgi:hypothetical protein
MHPPSSPAGGNDPTTGGTLDLGKVDYPYRYTTTVGAAHVRSSARYPTTGVWTEFTTPADRLCAVPCFRVTSVKTVGAVSVELIRLTEPEPIPQ